MLSSHGSRLLAVINRDQHKPNIFPADVSPSHPPCCPMPYMPQSPSSQPTPHHPPTAPHCHKQQSVQAQCLPSHPMPYDLAARCHQISLSTPARASSYTYSRPMLYDLATYWPSSESVLLIWDHLALISLQVTSPGVHGLHYQVLVFQQSPFLPLRFASHRAEIKAHLIVKSQSIVGKN